MPLRRYRDRGLGTMGLVSLSAPVLRLSGRASRPSSILTLLAPARRRGGATGGPASNEGQPPPWAVRWTSGNGTLNSWVVVLQRLCSEVCRLEFPAIQDCAPEPSSPNPARSMTEVLRAVTSIRLLYRSPY